MKAKKKIILIGAGGHCNSCIDVIEQENRYKIVGLIDKKKKSNSKYKIIGTDKDLKKIKKNCNNILVSIGQIKNFFAREKIYKFGKKNNFNFPIIISPNAFVSKEAKLGEGTIIMHGAIVNKNAKIGRNCIINTGSIVEHDVHIGDNCHISTGAIVNGGVTIGQNSFIGSGSVIKQSLKIGNQCFINAKKFLQKSLKNNSKFL